MSSVKEFKKLLNKKIEDSPINSAERIIALADEVEKSLKKRKDLTKRYTTELEIEFPLGTNKRAIYDAFATMYLDTTLKLFLIECNSLLIVELHGILERFALDSLLKVLPSSDEAEKIVIEGFKMKTLSDIANYMMILNLWDKDDVTFSRKLNSIRNGIAHKNIKLVSKYLSDGKQVYSESIHEVTKKVDCVPYILKVMNLMIKSSNLLRSSSTKNPRFNARLNAYSKEIANIFMLYCDPSFMHLEFYPKYTILNNIFRKISLISSEELAKELDPFIENIIAFHESVGQDKKEMDRTYDLLSTSVKNIFHLMRKDLSIDKDKFHFEMPDLINISDILKGKYDLKRTDENE